jgi:hypothetical protein
VSITGNPTFGLEDIQRAAIVQLFDNLNATLDEVEREWQIKDAEFYARMGRTDATPITVERIDPQNFVTGHRPSLISAPIENYPNVAVWTVRATPAPESAQQDHAAIYTDTVFIEVMVKSSPEEGEEVVNSRIQRTAEAVNLVIEADPTLGGMVTGLQADPTVELADVFTRKERTAYGDHWFWQGARLEYAVRKEMSLMDSSPDTGFFRSAGPFDIDQI